MKISPACLCISLHIILGIIPGISPGVGVVSGQEIKFTNPAQGDTFFVGDTAVLQWEWDSLFSETVASGFVVKASTNHGITLSSISPIGSEYGASINFLSDIAGDARWIISDSVFTQALDMHDSALQDTSVPLLFHVEGYGHHSLNDQVSCVLRPSCLFVTSPLSFDTLYLLDTLSIATILSKGYAKNATGIIVRFSPDSGAHWFDVPPVDYPLRRDVVVSDTGMITVRVVIPDTLSSTDYRDSLMRPKVYAAGSQNGLLAIHDSHNQALPGDTIAVITAKAPASSQRDSDNSEEGDGGCGTGAGLALIPAVAARCLQRKKYWGDLGGRAYPHEK